MSKAIIFYDALGRDRDWETILAQIVDFERGEEVEDPRCFDFFVTPRYLRRIELDKARTGGEG